MTVLLGGSKQIRLDDIFSQSEGYTITYTATSSDEALSVNVLSDSEGTRLRVRSNFELGTYYATVTADDTCEDSPSRRVQVEVEVTPLS